MARRKSDAVARTVSMFQEEAKAPAEKPLYKQTVATVVAPSRQKLGDLKMGIKDGWIWIRRYMASSAYTVEFKITPEELDELLELGRTLRESK